MKILHTISKTTQIGAVLLAAALVPSTAWSCACGCDIFSVGTSSMFPNGPGGLVFVNYDFQNQNQNWSGTSTAPASHNDDKDLQTSFTSFGVQYLFNPRWGVQLEVPYRFSIFHGQDR